MSILMISKHQNFTYVMDMRVIVQFRIYLPELRKFY